MPFFSSTFLHSEGSVIADMVATVHNHPDADDMFYAAFADLDMNKLFLGEDVDKIFDAEC